MTLQTNVHVHLFSADHSPPIQLYYLLHQTIRYAIEDFLPGKQDVDSAKYIRRLDRFGPLFEIGLAAAIVAAAVKPGLLRSSVAGLVRVTTRSSVADPDRVRQIFGQPAAPNPLSPADLLREVQHRIADARQGGSKRPFRRALAGIVNDLYRAHEQGVAAGKSLTHADMLQAFRAESGDRYTRTVVLTVNFDHAFAGKTLGVGTTPKLPFDAQVTELGQLARTVNQGNDPSTWALLPFLGLDPRHRATEAQLTTWVQSLLVPNGVYCGLKLYPPLRVNPADPKLAPIWDLCQDLGVPVTSHCGAMGGGVRDEESCCQLAHPKYWRPVLERLARRKETLQSGTKTFKLCLAHFADLERPDDESWSDEIMELMLEHDYGVKVYADLAYSKPRANRSQFKSNLRRLAKEHLLDHVLPGSDWWNLYPDFASEQQFLEEIHLDGATSDWWDIPQLERNAAEFLAI